jgi:hypothetical protein
MVTGSDLIDTAPPSALSTSADQSRIVIASWSLRESLEMEATDTMTHLRFASIMRTWSTPVTLRWVLIRNLPFPGLTTSRSETIFEILDARDASIDLSLRRRPASVEGDSGIDWVGDEGHRAGSTPPRHA